MKLFDLEILTPERELFSGKTASLTVQTLNGEIGILADHASLVSVLAPGPIRYKLESEEEIKIEGGEGSLIVRNNRAVVLLKV